MNIFKVLASRKKFPEEMSSALLGWLLHPGSEHGLGRTFLARFLCAIEGIDSSIYKQLNDLTDDKILCNLEEDVGLSQLDIIVFLGDFILAIENKIHDEAIVFGQLKNEYDGLLQKFPDKKVILVYLVPHKGGAAKTEYDNFVKTVTHPHISAFLTWIDTIGGILNDLLRESTVKKEKIPQRTQINMQMLHEFISDNFRGYNFMYRVKNNGEYTRLSYTELKEKAFGFVGVENGAGGLKKLSKEAIQNRMFPYDIVKVNVFWLPLKEFLAIAERKIFENSDMHVEQQQKRRGCASPGYMGKFSAVLIYEMVCQPDNNQIYIGIKSGERGFTEMSQQKIDSMSWQVTAGEQPNSQWISGSRYKYLYEEKFPERVI